MAQQLSFDLPARPALGRDAFFVAPSNALAVAAIDGWRDWVGGKLVLVGPEGAGKTHLSHVWAAESGAAFVCAKDLANADIPGLTGNPAIVVENASGVAGHAEDERALFHLHNLALAEGVALLLTDRNAPAAWQLRLPDLASRMQATQVARLDPPDDALFAAVLVKLFADRQLSVAPNLIDWMVRHAERSFQSAQSAVATLDAAALAEGRDVTRDLARRILGAG